MHVYSKIGNIELNVPDINIYYLSELQQAWKTFKPWARMETESVDFEFSLQCGRAVEVWVPVQGKSSIFNTWFNFSYTWALVYQKEGVVLSVGREVQTWIFLEAHLNEAFFIPLIRHALHIIFFSVFWYFMNVGDFSSKKTVPIQREIKESIHSSMHFLRERLQYERLVWRHLLWNFLVISNFDEIPTSKKSSFQDTVDSSCDSRNYLSLICIMWSIRWLWG